MLPQRVLLQTLRCGGSLLRPTTAVVSVTAVEGQRSCHQAAGVGGGASTVNESEMSRFRALSDKWWLEHGEFRALHSLNKLRVPFIRDAVLRKKRSDAVSSVSGRMHKPLTGVEILDVGCGGGILSESLCRLGGAVTGIDALEECIEVARLHACSEVSGREVRQNVRYECTTVEALAHPPDGQPAVQQYDVLVASEVVEHVDNPKHFIQHCSHLVKPGGSIVLTTINRTWLSYVLAIVAAEQILRIVPAGTHTHDKFISPAHLQDMLSESNFQTDTVHGMLYNPATGNWHWVANTDINYALHARRI